jgi:nitronate monooxygenase
MFGTRYPIVQAPMAGGTDTPDLAAAVSAAGGLGSLGCGYLAPREITAAIERVRALTREPFAVNLFVLSGPGPSPADSDFEPLDRDPAPMLELLGAYHRELRLPPPALPTSPGVPFAEQVAAVLAARVPVFSFTFGIPPPDVLAAFAAAGTLTVGTATTVREAALLAAAGVDAISAQGAEAGGHRGSFAADFAASMVPTAALVRGIVRDVALPVVAAGGIMDGAGICAALELGAVAAQLGTAFVACPESGASAAYKGAILGATDDTTAITRVFSGRPARGLRNRFMTEVEPHADAVLPYPWQNAATRPLRAAAARAGDAGLLNLWAGQGVSRARALPAAELVATLAREAGL